MGLRFVLVLAVCVLVAGCYETRQSRTVSAPDAGDRYPDTGTRRNVGPTGIDASGGKNNGSGQDGVGGSNQASETGGQGGDAAGHGGSGGASGSHNAAHPDSSAPAFVDAAIATLGTPCTNLGEKACTGHNSSQTLICGGSPRMWMLADACKSDSRCDTAVGTSSQGACQYIVTGCMDEAPGGSICVDVVIDYQDVSVRKRCGVDLLSYEDDDACPVNTHCVDLGGPRTDCGCDSGFEGGDEDAGAPDCIDIDECNADHGGCDPLASCINMPGSYACGPCPQSYAGTGKTGCVPVSTQVFGSSGLDDAFAITTDANGNVYVAGSTNGGLDGYTNAGGQDAFIVKFNGSGQKEWTRQFGSSGDDVARGVATDASGNVYAAGYTSGGLDGNTNAGSNDLFIVTYDGAGQKQWMRQIGSSGDDEAYGVATDSSGGVYVSGVAGVDSGTQPGFLVLKLDGAGEEQWRRFAESNPSGVGYGVATDANGNVYAAGTGYDASNPDSFKQGMLFVKYDASGEQQWLQLIGNEVPHSLSIATDASADVYVVADLAEGTWRHPQNGGRFFAKYDSAGREQWSQLTPNSLLQFYGLVIDASGKVYVAGMGAHGWNDGVLGGSDAVLIKYDGSGEEQWVRVFGSSESDSAACVAIDAGGTLHVAGTSYGDFDGFANAGGGDVFVTKFDATGKQL